MLDLAGLPKNMNGFRTTHTCELCGFEPKTKNKYREKQDHLVMKHFKEKIDKIFPHCRPYCCPTGDCNFTGKDKQALLRHYTGKHGILERYLREALAEKGINYTHETVKRKSNHHHSQENKKARQASPPVSATAVGAVNGTNGVNGVALNGVVLDPQNGVNGTPIQIIHSRPNTEELRKEVEAMMASFQPVEQNVVFTLPQNSSSGSAQPPIEAILPTTTSSPVVSNDISVATTSASSSSSINGINLSQLLASSTPIKINGASNNHVIVTPSNKTPLPSIRTIVPSNNAEVSTSAVDVAAASVVSSITTPLVIHPSQQQNGSIVIPSNIVENAEVMWGTGASAGPAVIVEAANAVTYIETVDGTTYTAANIENIDEYLYATPINTTEVRERQLDFCML